MSESCVLLLTWVVGQQVLPVVRARRKCEDTAHV